MTSDKAQQATILLAKLASELRLLSLWQSEKPSKQDLASTSPFCCDTLTFAQWLQFVFIAKITVMISSEVTLPSNISLTPMAEHAFNYLGNDATVLVNVIADIDELFSQS